MFSQAKSQTDPTPEKTNTLPSRGLTFVNNTSASTICLQTDSTFQHDSCSGANKISKGGSPYVIDSSTLKDGSNSGVAQLAAYQLKEDENWVNTGKDSSANGQVYATNRNGPCGLSRINAPPGPQPSTYRS